MTRSSQPAPAGARVQPATWGRGDRVLLFLVDKTPTRNNAYAAHVVLGVLIGVMA
jgi:hypothetical protein